MSLGKLLATGRSLAGGPSVGRYNVSERNRLPKFNAARNPFASPAANPAAEPPAAAKPATAEAPVPVTSGPTAVPPTAGVELKATQRLPIPDWTVAARGVRLKRAVVAGMKRVGSTSAAWMTGMVAFLGRLPGRFKRVRRQEPVPVLPRLGKPAVQGELSLDKVQVVRNDLEESDLEIVTAETNTGAQVAPTVAPAAPNRGPMPPALKKMTNRMPGVKLG